MGKTIWEADDVDRAVEKDGTVAREPAESENEEELPEGLQCCVCLDLLYKPIALACGHVCCFWCVHKSMSGYGDSSCAFCRNSYNHFPSICHTFHLLIRKKFPVAYRRREQQVLEEEKEHGCFSPQFGEAADCADSNANNGASQVLSVNDALCPSCKQLLYRPLVLNCGHAFCRSCVTNLQNGSLICEVCQSPHPGECSKVCLEFDRFLQEEFPEAYVQRRAAVGQIACTHEGSSICTGTSQTKKVVKVVPRHAEMHERYQDVHFGVGCDTCGAFPIIGKRYRCTGCTEEIGFDMCDLCYNSKSKLPGRFNQQHKPEHSFKLVRPPIIRYNILGFLDDELIEENHELSG
ncbi:E3 ubiquitin-protein ligase [Nymphaea thermarum]|nr:E3 ubiquitin-protein ligase [Nymphaea thermarum]